MTYQPSDLTHDTSRELSRALDQAIEAFQQLQDARATPSAFLATREQDARLCEQVEDQVRALGYAMLDFMWRGGELFPDTTHEEVTAPVPPTHDTPPVEPRAPTPSPAPTRARELTQAQMPAPAPIPTPVAETTTESIAVDDEEERVIPEVMPLAPTAPPVAITQEMLAELQASFEQTDDLIASSEGDVSLDVDEGWMYAADHLDVLVTQIGKPGAFRSVLCGEQSKQTVSSPEKRAHRRSSDSLCSIFRARCSDQRRRA